MTQTRKKRISKILLKLISVLAFSIVCSFFMTGYSDRQFTQVFHADWRKLQPEIESALGITWQLGGNPLIDEVSPGVVEVLGPSDCYQFWNALFCLFPVTALVALSFSGCLWLIKRSPLCRFKKCSRLVALLLAVPLVYLILYGYLISREQILQSRFSLKPENTKVILEYISWLGGPNEPCRILYCNSSELDPASLTNSLQCCWSPERLNKYDLCNLSTEEMQTAINLLESYRIFSLGPYNGPWIVIDGSQLFITVDDGVNRITTSCRVPDERGEPVSMLYNDLSGIRPWKKDR